MGSMIFLHKINHRVVVHDYDFEAKSICLMNELLNEYPEQYKSTIDVRIKPVLEEKFFLSEFYSPWIAFFCYK
jgi:myosin-crossreactive antigen